jgi:hypothetical protein
MKKEDSLSDEFLKQYKTGEDLNVYLSITLKLKKAKNPITLRTKPEII